MNLYRCTRGWLLSAVGLIAIVCGIVMFEPDAVATASGNPGPMSGSWAFTIKSKIYFSNGDKPLKITGNQIVNITDSPGAASSIIMETTEEGMDPQTLVGTRVGNAFYVETPDSGAPGQFVYIYGTISPPGADGLSKLIKGAGGVVGTNGGAVAPETSDGGSPATMTIGNVTGKRNIN
ncbi:MAG: hypothetical protein ACKVS6_00780 [Planctomycetota bacterium]